jgi:acyl dehydratase
VRFPNPVPVNSQLRIVSKVVAIKDIDNNSVKVTFSCIIEIKGQEKPACVAEFIAAFYE